eukprot:3157566-Prymnesium_polylepis.1
MSHPRTARPSTHSASRHRLHLAKRMCPRITPREASLCLGSITPWAASLCLGSITPWAASTRAAASATTASGRSRSAHAGGSREDPRPWAVG